MTNYRLQPLPGQKLRTPGPLNGAQPRRSQPLRPTMLAQADPENRDESQQAKALMDSEIQKHKASEKPVLAAINKFIDEAFRSDEITAEMLKGKSPAEQKQIRITTGLEEDESPIGPPAKYLKKALESATHARKLDSLDPVNRSAQYYFHTRSRVAATPDALKPFSMMGGALFAAVWDGAKWVLPEPVESFLMQKDKDKPNSPPGGWIWGVLGAMDGLLDLNKTPGKPRYAKETPQEALQQIIKPLAAALVNSGQVRL